MQELCPVCNCEVEGDQGSCPQCGFKLIGSTQSFKPVTLSADELRTEASVPHASASLRVIRGPQIEKVYVLEDGTYTIGRSPQSEVFLNDMTVSRSHAQITRAKEGFVIRDLKSFNGVWINNKSVDEAVLAGGDIIQIGAFCLLYREG